MSDDEEKATGKRADGDAGGQIKLKHVEIIELVNKTKEAVLMRHPRLFHR